MYNLFQYYPETSISIKIYDKNLVWISSSLILCYNTVLGYQHNSDVCVIPHGLWETHVIITYMWLKIIKLHIMKFSLSLCTQYYFPNYTVLLKHSQPMCFPCGGRYLTYNKLQVKFVGNASINQTTTLTHLLVTSQWYYKMLSRTITKIQVKLLCMYIFHIRFSEKWQWFHNTGLFISPWNIKKIHNK
jgi:hypothetical protein